MQIVRLKSGHDQRLRHGHAWVFSNEIQGDVSALEPGGAVQVLDNGGRFLGVGFANPASLISVRLLSREASADIDSVDFFARRLREAEALRARVLPGRRSYRLVAGEADFLPGLIIDRYGDVLAVQMHALGMDRRRDLLASALREVFSPAGVVLRNEAAVRGLEGLPPESGLWFGEVPERVEFEAGSVGDQPLRLWADVLGGQKTGFFFDQGENRAFAARICGGMRVLDLYANSGAWAIGALLGGAAHATAVEINPRTAEIIQANAALNGVGDRIDVRAEDVKVLLSGQAGRDWDAVFLDPPAFAKSRKAAGAALAGYRDINRAALSLVRPGGLLFTSSCSYHVEEERFEGAVQSAAFQARRALRQIRRGEQGPDHPVLPGFPETRYLKHFVYQVL